MMAAATVAVMAASRRKRLVTSLVLVSVGGRWLLKHRGSRVTRHAPDVIVLVHPGLPPPFLILPSPGTARHGHHAHSPFGTGGFRTRRTSTLAGHGRPGTGLARCGGTGTRERVADRAAGQPAALAGEATACPAGHRHTRQA